MSEEQKWTNKSSFSWLSVSWRCLLCGVTELSLFLLFQGEELNESAQESRANAEMHTLLAQKFLGLPWKPEVKHAFIVLEIYISVT